MWTEKADSGCLVVMAKTSKGHIRQLPSGSFRVKVYAGTDPVTGYARLLRQTCSDEVLAAAKRTAPQLVSKQQARGRRAHRSQHRAARRRGNHAHRGHHRAGRPGRVGREPHDGRVRPAVDHVHRPAGHRADRLDQRSPGACSTRASPIPTRPSHPSRTAATANSKQMRNAVFTALEIRDEADVLQSADAQAHHDQPGTAGARDLAAQLAAERQRLEAATPDTSNGPPAPTHQAKRRESPRRTPQARTGPAPWRSAGAAQRRTSDHG